jgi:predicted acetyltransferase
MDRIDVEPCSEADAYIVRNLYPLYLHDLSEFGGQAPNRHGVLEPDDVATLDEQGRLAYQRVWWSRPGVLYPHLIRVDGLPAGFALVAGQPVAGEAADHAMQEFFVSRAHRKRGIGTQAAARLFGVFPGRWSIAVMLANEPALRFWRAVARAHARTSVLEREEERQLVIRFAAQPIA